MQRMQTDSALPEPPLVKHDWALFLDVDGSLAEHAPTPEALQIDPVIKHALPALSRWCSDAVALVARYGPERPFQIRRWLLASLEEEQAA
jgi:trehalose 6-phosphate phosphatase